MPATTTIDYDSNKPFGSILPCLKHIHLFSEIILSFRPFSLARESTSVKRESTLLWSMQDLQCTFHDEVYLWEKKLYLSFFYIFFKFII